MTITIQDGHEIGYQNDRPVIVVNHQLSAENCRDLLPRIIKTLGADQVKNELEKHVTAVERGKFMCFVPGSRAPIVTHNYINHAGDEAVRLANKTGLDVTVVRVVAVAKRKLVPVPQQYEVIVETVS